MAHPTPQEEKEEETGQERPTDNKGTQAEAERCYQGGRAEEKRVEEVRTHERHTGRVIRHLYRNGVHP